MTTSSAHNADRMREILDLLKQVLVPLVISRYTAKFAGDPVKAVNDRLSSSLGYVRIHDLSEISSPSRPFDTQNILKLLLEPKGRTHNGDLFPELKSLNRERATELTEWRNLWGHEKPFTDKDVLDAAHSTRVLLEAFGKSEITKQLSRIESEYGTKIYDVGGRRTSEIQIAFKGRVFQGRSLSELFEQVLMYLYNHGYLAKMPLPIIFGHRPFICKDSIARTDKGTLRNPVKYVTDEGVFYMDIDFGREIALRRLKNVLKTHAKIDMEILRY